MRFTNKFWKHMGLKEVETNGKRELVKLDSKNTVKLDSKKYTSLKDLRENIKKEYRKRWGIKPNLKNVWWEKLIDECFAKQSEAICKKTQNMALHDEYDRQIVYQEDIEGLLGESK